MNSSTTLHWRRGAVLGLALLSCLPSIAQADPHLLRELLRDKLRGKSYMIIDTDGVQEVIILGEGMESPRVQLASFVDQRDALQELADGDPEHAVGALLLALDDPSYEVRTTAIRLLGEIDSIESRMALETLLTHPDAALRLEMVEAVADAPGAGELLRMATVDRSAVVADAAIQYLRERTDGPLR